MMRNRMMWLQLAWRVKGRGAKRLALRVAFSSTSTVNSITKSFNTLAELAREAV